jgi:hypothetical protein
MVKQIKLLKNTFFKNDDDKGGALAQSIKECPENNITIKHHSNKNGQAWGFTTPEKYVDMITKNNNLYEMITKYPFKIYFDVDVKDTNDLANLQTKEQQDNFFDKTLKIITDFFIDADIAVSGSIYPDKISYHFVLNNYMIYNDADKLNLKAFVNINKHNYFDTAPYGKTQAFKSINQTKPRDERVQTIILNNDYKKHLVSCYFNNYIKPFPEFNIDIKETILLEKAKKIFDIGILPKLKLTCNSKININTASPEEILALLPFDTQFDYQHKIARYCYSNGLTFENYLSWLQKGIPNITKTNSGQRLWDKLADFPPCYIEHIKGILIHFYPSINKNINYREFIDTFDLPENLHFPIETITPKCFENNEKWSIFNVGMGGGKTAQTISYLKYQGNYVWIAPNKALSENTIKRFEDEHIEIKHYLNDFTKKEKDNGCFNDVDKLMIVLNSIHYLKDKEFEIVIIDEIETVLHKFYGEFLEQGDKHLKKIIWNIFCNILKNAKKVILLDAFVTMKTINFIKSIDNEYASSCNIYKRIFEPQTRTIKYCNSVEMMLKDIIDKIKNGNKLFIFYPYKKHSGLFSSMETLYNMIKDETGCNGEMYNADVDDKTKKQLKDVNGNWNDLKFIITNNILTCGVNYENKDFDYKYIFIASHNLPRDVIQVSYRVRHLLSGIIIICYMGSMNQSNTWVSDKIRMDDKRYELLYDSIITEMKAPIKKSFSLFCNKANYRQEIDTKEINIEIEFEIKQLLAKYYSGYSYNTIEIIDNSQAENIEQLCMAQNATLYDKMCLRKYYFIKQFTDEANKITNENSNNDENMLEYIWDDNYIFFFENLKKLLCNTDNLFNKIKELNKFNTIFPTDIKKTKLNPEIIDLIFKHFVFNYISKSSSPHKIVKEIYNTFFGKFIITTQTDINKHITYNIDNNLKMLYDFACQYLIINKECNITYNNTLIEIDDENIF